MTAVASGACAVPARCLHASSSIFRPMNLDLAYGRALCAHGLGHTALGHGRALCAHGLTGRTARGSAAPAYLQVASLVQACLQPTHSGHMFTTDTCYP